VSESAYETKIVEQVCRKCGDWRVELHHLLPRSKFSRRRKHLQDDPDNSIPLCHRCHQDHHTTTKRVPRKLLTSEELAFLELHIHPSWIDRWYPNKEES
jgi:hypothetical protein